MISIIVPHYNDVELLSKNLPKLVGAIKKSRLEWEIIIADDASPKEALVGLRKLVHEFEEGKVRLIEAKKNVGFGPTVNRAFLTTSGEIVFVLKVDVLPKEVGYFAEILKGFDDPGVFAVSSALESVEDGKREIRGQGVVLFFRGLFQHFRTRGDFRKWLLTNRTTRKLAFEMDQKKEDVEKNGHGNYSAWPDGGSSAYRRSIFLRLGGFDSIYAPFYWEDTDLGYRAWRAGYKVLFASKGVLTHDYREGSIHRYHSDRYLKVLNLRNQWLFAWVNSDIKTLFKSIIWTPYHMAVAVKNGDFDLFKGLISAKLKLVVILKARYERSKYFVKTDDSVLHFFENI